MTFNSWIFAASFLSLLIAYLIIRRLSWHSAKWVLVFYSYLFYSFWNYYFVLLLLASTVLDYVVARLLQRHPGHRQLLAAISLTLNLGALGFFKYAGFASAVANSVSGALGIPLDVTFAQNIILPIGISFYTFQTLSYTLDVYRGEVQATRNFVDVALFVAFFPQLVAGPIVRGSHFLPQLARLPRISLRQVHRGIYFVAVGLVWKVVVADGVAPRVEHLFANYDSASSGDAWLAGALFGVQIYGDFNGYSLTAIGLASIMGFTIPGNFNSPYAALSFSDFWRRWHISLSTWLRDYLYIPLGGNRRGEFIRIRNLIITMGLGGLWHGAAMHFVVWGLVHGGLLVAQNAAMRCSARYTQTPNFAAIRLQAYRMIPRFGPIRAVLHHSSRFVWAGVIFAIISLTWILFRASGIDEAMGIYGKIADFDMQLRLADRLDVLIVASIIFLAHLDRYCSLRRRLMGNRYLYGTVIAGALVALFYLKGPPITFIYFQF